MFFFSPIEHFEVNYLNVLQYGDSHITLETISLYIFLTLIPILFIFIQFKNNISMIIKQKSFFLFEIFYNFILNDIIKLQISSIRAQRYFPIIFNIFLIILILNISSLIP